MAIGGNTESERLLIVEHKIGEIRESLQMGAKRFTQIDELLRPSIAKVAAWFCAFIFTAAIPVCVTVFKLGKYPDAESFIQSRADYQAAQKALEQRVQALEVSRAEQEIRLRTISDTLSRVETKLDSALSARRR